MEGIEYIDFLTCKRILESAYDDTTLEFANATFEEFSMKDHTLYSFERLVGKMGRGYYKYEIAERLKRIGFKKILITIRRQDSMVESIYRQHIHQGGVLKSKDFIKDREAFRWSYLDFNSLIDRYIELFGIENILIIPQEKMRSDLDGSLEELRDFCGADKIEVSKKRRDSNISLSYWSVKLLRIINHFTYNMYRPSQLISKRITTWKFRYVLQSKLDTMIIRRVLKNRKFFDDTFKEEVRKRYEAGNKELSQKFGLGLEKYGYFS